MMRAEGKMAVGISRGAGRAGTVIVITVSLGCNSLIGLELPEHVSSGGSTTGSAGGGDTVPVCTGNAHCDDNNPCTEDRCDAGGTCVNSQVINGMADGPCRTCVDGVPEVTGALCHEGRVCNGLGECVSCQAEPCPTGYKCTGEVCLGDHGTPCSLNDECAGGLPCVDSVCCSSLCEDECVSCNGEKPGTCEASPQYEPDTLCINDEVCDGLGTCKRNNGAACGLDGHCASSHCQDGLCEPQ